MKLLIYISIFFGGLFVSNTVSAQNTNELIRLSGTIMSNDSLFPIQGVNVINIRNNTGVTSNDKGFFSISIHRIDTIQFSAVGYETYRFVLDATSQSNSPLVQIKLLPKTYELQQVDIVAMPTEKQFKKEFLALQLPDEPELALPNIKQPQLMEGVDYLPAGGVSISGPFSALYNKFSREAKEKKKVQILSAQEFKRKKYETKFNAQIVGRVTGLKDEALQEFMKYCKLSEATVLNANNEYEIALAINNCFKEYKEMKGKN